MVWAGGQVWKQESGLAASGRLAFALHARRHHWQLESE